jgi:hypothetical protein
MVVNLNEEERILREDERLVYPYLCIGKVRGIPIADLPGEVKAPV